VATMLRDSRYLLYITTGKVVPDIVGVGTGNLAGFAVDTVVQVNINPIIFLLFHLFHSFRMLTGTGPTDLFSPLPNIMAVSL